MNPMNLIDPMIQQNPKFEPPRRSEVEPIEQEFVEDIVDPVALARIAPYLKIG